jgi:hypothetical protein
MCWRVDTNKQRMVPAQSINQTFVTANHNQEHLSQPITIKRICHNQSQSRAFVTTNHNQENLSQPITIKSICHNQSQSISERRIKKPERFACHSWLENGQNLSRTSVYCSSLDVSRLNKESKI